MLSNKIYLDKTIPNPFNQQDISTANNSETVPLPIVSEADSFYLYDVDCNWSTITYETTKTVILSKSLINPEELFLVLISRFTSAEFALSSIYDGDMWLGQLVQVCHTKSNSTDDKRMANVAWQQQFDLAKAERENKWQKKVI